MDVVGGLWCAIGGCSRSRLARGWCSLHYQRWKRHGDPMVQGIARVDGTAIERFTAKVAIALPGGCWEWTAHRHHRHGYAEFWYEDRWQRAHRVSWMLFRGPIPRTRHVLHDCDNPPCVNPDHLYLGTNDDNVRDRMVRGRHARGERAGGARLTEGDVHNIRRRYDDGESGASIARDFGIHSTHALAIGKRRRWAWLD